MEWLNLEGIGNKKKIKKIKKKGLSLLFHMFSQ
jgi:hypothetical protein